MKNSWVLDSFLNSKVGDVMAKHNRAFKPTLIFSATRKGCKDAANGFLKSACGTFDMILGSFLTYLSALSPRRRDVTRTDYRAHADWLFGYLVLSIRHVPDLPPQAQQAAHQGSAAPAPAQKHRVVSIAAWLVLHHAGCPELPVRGHGHTARAFPSCTRLKSVLIFDDFNSRGTSSGRSATRLYRSW